MIIRAVHFFTLQSLHFKFCMKENLINHSCEKIFWMFDVSLKYKDSNINNPLLKQITKLHSASHHTITLSLWLG